MSKVRGRYYAYATALEDRPPKGAGVFEVLTGVDLVHWQSVGTALSALGAPYYRYWAPEVTEDNGHFLLYYAAHTAEFAATIRVAVAERPEGPFVDSGRDLTGHLFPWAIDPHVFRDHDGQWYLYITIEYWNDPAGQTGSGNAVVRLRDPFTVEGAPARVTPPRHAWELFEARRPEKGGADWYTVEGPAVLRHRGRYYEMFSGGCYYRDNYAVSYATSKTPMGPGGMRDDSWRDWEGDPAGDGARPGDGRLMKGTPGYVLGPGHNSSVRGPNNADLYIAYHAWPADLSARRPCIDRLYWHGDDLWTPAPTCAPQPVPAEPRLRDLFDDGALTGWSAAGGRWVPNPGGGHVAQEDGIAPATLLRHREALGDTWLLEVNARYNTGLGSYGVWMDGGEQGGWEVLLDPSSRRLSVRSDSSSSSVPDRQSARSAQSAPLPDRFVPGAWHQLLLAYAGELLTVHLDGLPTLDARIRGLTGAFGLRTAAAAAAFSGVSLTDHFRDEFLDERVAPTHLGWREPASRAGRDVRAPSSWWVCEGALEHRPVLPVKPDQCGEPEASVLLKGAPRTGYEFGATLKLLQRDYATRPDIPGACPAAGLALCRDGGELLIALGGDEACPTLTVRGDGHMAKLAAARDLPAGFDPHRWHTLMVVRDGDDLALGRF